MNAGNRMKKWYKVISDAKVIAEITAPTGEVSQLKRNVKHSDYYEYILAVYENNKLVQNISGSSGYAFPIWEKWLNDPDANKDYK